MLQQLQDTHTPISILSSFISVLSPVYRWREKKIYLENRGIFYMHVNK